MAQTATIYTVTIDLSDLDRGVFETLELRVARHPSETAEYMLVRLMAYCLEYEEGIALTEGVSSGDEPALVVRDLTGRVTAWIEVGLPDAARLHRGSKLAGRAAVYTHRDVRQLLAQLAAILEREAADAADLVDGITTLDEAGCHDGMILVVCIEIAHDSPQPFHRHIDDRAADDLRHLNLRRRA